MVFYYPTTCKILVQLTNIYLVFNHYKALETFGDILQAMKLKYDKYWDNVPLIFGMAIVMDSRYKFELVGEWISSLRKTIFDLYEYYKNIIGQN